MVQIAILGFGVVGSGVAQLIERNADNIAAGAHRSIRLKHIVDIRPFPDSPFADRVGRDFSLVENDPEIQVVVETIGGVGAALDFTRRALSAGKHVVTSNKELVALYGDELLALAHARNVNYLFEASVGGGIPIIRPISQCLAANRLTDIVGILNGTTNYILTRMADSGLSFHDALAEARAEGYAEADPTDDVEGRDACRKICILASLAFGHHIYPDQVRTEGIGHITASDIQYARNHGFCLKLLGRAHRTDDGVRVFVAPHLVANSSTLASVSGVYNGITVTGDAIGRVMFYGQGAGALPTASAVVADVIDAVKHFHAHKYLSWAPALPGGLLTPDGLVSRWFTRDGDGLCAISPPLADWRPWAASRGMHNVTLALRVLDESNG